MRNSFSLLPGIIRCLLNVQHSPGSTVARRWDAARCEKAGAGFRITYNLETHVRSLCGSPGWRRSAHGCAWTRPSPRSDVPPLPPVPCAGSADMVFFTLCFQLLCNIAECCLIYTRWLGFDEKLNKTGIWFMHPFCKVI